MIALTSLTSEPGNKGRYHINSQKKDAEKNNIAQVAVCDVYQRNLDAGREMIGLKEDGRLPGSSQIA